jgi:hypothetical protein
MNPAAAKRSKGIVQSSGMFRHRERFTKIRHAPDSKYYFVASQRNLGPVRGMQFTHDMLQMNLHGALRNAKLMRNDLVRLSFTNKIDDLLFPMS